MVDDHSIFLMVGESRTTGHRFKEKDLTITQRATFPCRQCGYMERVPRESNRSQYIYNVWNIFRQAHEWKKFGGICAKWRQIFLVYALIGMEWVRSKSLGPSRSWWSENIMMVKWTIRYFRKMSSRISCLHGETKWRGCTKNHENYVLSLANIIINSYSYEKNIKMSYSR